MKLKYSVDDLSKKLDLPLADPVPSFVSVMRYPSSVAITGAQGYFGSFVISEFLRRGVRVHGYVRRPIVSQNPLLCYHYVDDLLNVNEYPSDVEAVIHASANTSTAKNLDQLWVDNVSITKHLFSLAQKTNKRFLHISSLSVFASSDFSGHVAEEESLLSAENLYGGYAASKWCAERWLLEEASKKPTPLSVYRLGLLMSPNPHPKTPLVPVVAAIKLFGGPPKHLVSSSDFFDATSLSYAAKSLCNSIQTSGIFNVSGGPLCASTLHNCLEKVSSRQEAPWPNLETKDARRILGRWFNQNHQNKMWWTDIFQSGKITFDTKKMAEYCQPAPWTSKDLEEHIRMLSENL